ncbi:hypothetical protein [Cloacibacillus sp.]|uniref:hypothetical protein n=1 Tax=Cloacibacillus sp. TaxID=2049023 RepID=UPI0025BE24BA|nr:hypothetical protein [Cloacibacillus sp.]MCC8057225.1 hypothetical protein [Cloacibacillus sp.]
MTPDRTISLANDIACAIATLQAVADELLTAYPDSDYDREDDAAIVGQISQQPMPSKKATTLEEVRGILADKASSGHRESVQALIQKHGAKRLSEVDPSEFDALIEEARAIK